MEVFAISSTAGYQGCGKAWGAVVNDEVVALRYMEQVTTFRFLPGFNPDAPDLSLVRFDDNWGGRPFADYRKAAKAELGAIGEVKTGMCSCWQFCVGN